MAGQHFTFRYDDSSLANDIAMLKILNHVFPEHAILPPCKEYEPAYCSILAVCGTGRSTRRHHYLSLVLKELYLLQEIPNGRERDSWSDLICTRR